MQRRKFFKGITAASALSLVSLNTSFGEKSALKVAEKIKPHRLKVGDTVALVSPASGITRDELFDSLNNLEAMGLIVQYSENMRVKKGYLGGTDKQRADDINEMFANKDIAGIFCARGGYGTPRILPLLDYELIRKNPKPLIGYSDITALLYAIYSRTGLITFHGPVGKSNFTPYASRILRQVVFEPTDNLLIPHADIFNKPAPLLVEQRDTKKRRRGVEEQQPEIIIESPVVQRDPIFEPYTIRGGIAEGELMGGNLTLIITLMGTPFEMNFDDKLVFIEEIGEEPYRMDRMLTQLLLAGKFDKAKGIAIGVCKGCEIDLVDPKFKESLSLKEVLFDRLKDLGIPVVYGMSFGHVPDNATLPLGIRAKLDVTTRSFTLLEQAVV
jgi:muramoyltetrapeptide carboxypeptidase